MFIPASNQIPEDRSISVNFVYLLGFYDDESIIADILLTDEETVKKTQTQRNNQISNEMLKSLWRLAMKIILKYEHKRSEADKAGREVKFSEREMYLERCAIRLEKETDRELLRRSIG